MALDRQSGESATELDRLADLVFGRLPYLYPDEVEAESRKHKGGWLHHCGTELLGARVHHSVHDGPFPLSGSGKVQVQRVPYCPSCHEKPSEYGEPLHPGDTKWPKVRIKRRAIDGSTDG